MNSSTEHSGWITGEEGLIYAKDQHFSAHPSRYVVAHADTIGGHANTARRHADNAQESTHNARKSAANVGNARKSAASTDSKSMRDHENRHSQKQPLIALARGVYFPHEQWLGLHATDQFRLRVKAHIRPGSSAIVTGEAAAALHGLPLLTRHARIAVANSGRCPGKPRIARSNIAGQGAYTHVPNKLMTHVSSRIRTEDIIEINGRRVTSIPKTVVDVCRSKVSENGLLLADAALQQSDIYPDFLEVLDAYARAPGNKRARLIISQATDKSETIGESLAKQAIVMAGVAGVNSVDKPLLQQVQFSDDLGFVGRVDFYLPHLRLVIEFDGDIKYAGSGVQATEETMIAEHKREKRLKNLHLNVLRLTWSDVLRKDCATRIRAYVESLLAR